MFGLQMVDKGVNLYFFPLCPLPFWVPVKAWEEVTSLTKGPVDTL